MSGATAHDHDHALREEPGSREAAILDELAELGLDLARGLQQRALGAEKADEAASLATAFQRVARTVRQCLALKSKLSRDARGEERERQREADAEMARRIRARKAVVTARVAHAIAEQSLEDEDDLTDSRLEDLRDRLDDEILDERFLEDDVTDVIARLHRQLGLKPPAPAGRPEPDPDPDDGEGAEADTAPPPEPWQANGRLAPPQDLPSWETG